MRRSVDGLSGMVQLILKHDPLSRQPVPLSKSDMRIDQDPLLGQDGMALWYKRLEQGTFQFPTDVASGERLAVSMEIS